MEKVNQNFKSKGLKSMRLNVMLIDDEQLALDFLERQLSKIDHIEVVGKYFNPMVGKDNVLESKVDAVFLDVNMPGINGIDLAGQILELKPDIIIVFVTAYDQYAVDAFELNALDYIVKPIELERLKRTIDRIRLQKRTSLETLATNRKLYIQLCGELKMGKSMSELKHVTWRTAKAQELFLYLLQNRGRLVRKSTLIELLWMDFELKKAYSQLYTAIYHIRRTLRAFGTHFEIKSTMDGYILYVNDVQIDIETWENELILMHDVKATTLQQYERVMALFMDMYLVAHDYLWLENERHRLEQIWIKAAFAIARCYQDENNIEKAMEWYQAICRREPDAEEAHFALMKAFAGSRKHMSVMQQYEQLNNIMKELGVPPSTHITEWYDQWAQDHLASKQ